MKKILPFCLLAIGLGFAQTTWTPPDPSSESLSPAAPVPEIKHTSSVFDAVRGHSYNPFSIAGAASSVNDLVTTPSYIYGKRFFYVSPTDKLGYVSFDLFRGSSLLGLTNQLNEDGTPLLASLILGYASSTFGIALEYSIRKNWTQETINDVTQSSRTTFLGDNIGLYFSLPLGSATAYANAKWLTYNSEINETEGMQNPADNYWTKVDSSTIDANLGLLGNIGALNYDAYLNIERTGGTLTSSNEDFSSMGEKVVTEDSYLEVSLNVNLGYAILQNEVARIIVGFNNMLGIRFLDEVDPSSVDLASGSIMGLIISPNIFGETVLTDNWLAFAGAKHDINFIFGAETPREKDQNETDILQANLKRYLQTGEIVGTEAFVGIRYQKPNWAFEAQISANPFKALDGENVFSFGGFIYF